MNAFSLVRISSSSGTLLFRRDFRSFSPFPVSGWASVYGQMSTSPSAFLLSSSLSSENPRSPSLGLGDSDSNSYVDSSADAGTELILDLVIGPPKDEGVAFEAAVLIALEKVGMSSSRLLELDGLMEDPAFYYQYLLELHRLQKNFNSFCRDENKHHIVCAYSRSKEHGHLLLVGYADIDRRILSENLERPKPYISDMVTHPLYRRKGIGAKVLKFSCENIAEGLWNENTQYLRVEADNGAALGLYLAQGFSPVVGEIEVDGPKWKVPPTSSSSSSSFFLLPPLSDRYQEQEQDQLELLSEPLPSIEELAERYDVLTLRRKGEGEGIGSN